MNLAKQLRISIGEFNEGIVLLKMREVLAADPHDFLLGEATSVDIFQLLHPPLDPLLYFASFFCQCIMQDAFEVLPYSFSCKLFQSGMPSM